MYLISDGTIGEPITAIVVESRDDVQAAITTMILRGASPDAITVNPVAAPFAARDFPWLLMRLR